MIKSSPPVEVEIPRPGIFVKVYKEGYETRELFIYPGTIKQNKIEIVLKRSTTKDGEKIEEAFWDALVAEKEGDLYLAKMEFEKTLEKYKKGIRILTWLLENRYKDYPYVETRSNMYLSLARMYSKLNNDIFLFLEVEPRLPDLRRLDREINQLKEELDNESQIVQELVKKKQDVIQEETEICKLNDKISTDTKIDLSKFKFIEEILETVPSK